MQSKCQCQWCGGNIEFATEEFQEMGRSGEKIFGQYVPCPHCKKETIITLAREALPADLIIAGVAKNKSTALGGSSRLETNLESAGALIIILGIVGAVACGALTFMLNQPVFAIAAIGGLFQAWVSYLVLNALAEILRRLRTR